MTVAGTNVPCYAVNILNGTVYIVGAYRLGPPEKVIKSVQMVKQHFMDNSQPCLVTPGVLAQLREVYESGS